MRPVTLPCMLFLAVHLLGSSTSRAQQARPSVPTATPIKHVVVIFDENNAFDHYFGTYPVALNPPGEPAFYARPGTPTANGLTPV
jgi:phospholipase C